MGPLYILSSQSSRWFAMLSSCDPGVKWTEHPVCIHQHPLMLWSCANIRQPWHSFFSYLILSVVLFGCVFFSLVVYLKTLLITMNDVRMFLPCIYTLVKQLRYISAGDFFCTRNLSDVLCPHPFVKATEAPLALPFFVTTMRKCFICSFYGSIKY